MTQLRDTPEPGNGYILVAEDDQVAQLVVKRILEQAGYKADLAADGKEAISALESNVYDLVVMDCYMPRMDGFAATRFIRSAGSDRINPAIPIIALTGLSAQADLLRCMDAGMNLHVSKPVDSHRLIEAVEQCLGKTENMEPASQQNEKRAGQVWEDGFLDTLIENFLEEVPQVIAGLRQAVKQGDVVKLQHIGHRLRGTTDILEASTLSARSQALEQAGKDGDITVASRLAAELINELQKLNTSLTG